MQRVLGILLLYCGLSVSSADVSQVCKDQKFGNVVANPSDCASYYVCGRLPIINHCAAGLHFDVRAKVCNWPELAKCRVATKIEDLTDTIISRKTEEAIALMDSELKATKKNSKKQKEMEKTEEVLAAVETEKFEESQKDVKKSSKTKNSNKKQKELEKTLETEELTEAETAIKVEKDLDTKTPTESEEAIEKGILKQTSKTMKKDGNKQTQDVEKGLTAEKDSSAENESKTSMEAENKTEKRLLKETQKTTKKSNKHQKQLEKEKPEEKDNESKALTEAEATLEMPEELEPAALIEAEVALEMELLQEILEEMQKKNGNLNTLEREMPDELTGAKEMEKHIRPDGLFQAEAGLGNQFKHEALSEAEAALEMKAIQEALKELNELYKNQNVEKGEFEHTAVAEAVNQDTPIAAIRPAEALQINDVVNKNKHHPKNQLELEKEFQAGVEDLKIPPQIDLIREMSLPREPEVAMPALQPEEMELIREALRETKIRTDVDKTAAVIMENIASAVVPVSVREVDKAPQPLDIMQLLTVGDSTGIDKPVEPKPLASLNGAESPAILAALEAAIFGAAVSPIDATIAANPKPKEDKEQPVAVKEAITKPRLTFVAIDVDTHTPIDPLNSYDPEQVECHHYGAYFLPHPRDCRKYYLCAFGHLLQHQCGRGTGWNYQRQECEVRKVAECYATLPDDDEFEVVAAPAQEPDDEQPFVLSPLTPDPYTTTLPYGDGAMVCFLYADGTTNAPTWSYTSSTGTWAPTGSHHTATGDDNWTPTGSAYTNPQFTPRTTTPTTTLSTERANSGDNTILMCPMNGQAYLPHTRDCSKYYICIVGMPVLTSCPDGLYWDQRAEFCDLAKNVNCPQIQN